MYKLVLTLLVIVSSLSATAAQFKVTTINVWGKPTNKKRDLDSRIVEICKVLSDSNHEHFQNWDVILIQEAWLRSVRRKLISCASALYPYQMGKSERSWKTGLITLSRFPIIRKEIFKLNSLFTLKQRLLGLDSSEKFVSKSIYMSLIKVSQTHRPVWFLNTHLAANFLPKGNDHSFFRKRQLLALINQAKKKSKNHPVVLGGDFNFSINGKYAEPENFKLLKNDKDQTFENSYLSAQNKYDLVQTYSKSLGNVYAYGDDGQLDHLWHTSGLESFQSGMSFHQKIMIKGQYKNYSDHFGWETTYKLK